MHRATQNRDPGGVSTRQIFRAKAAGRAGTVFVDRAVLKQNQRRAALGAEDHDIFVVNLAV